MSEMGEVWNELKKVRQEKRADNRLGSAQMLREAGIQFESKNLDAHLIVRSPTGLIDFWPGTGLWIVRGETKRHGGVRNLIKFCLPPDPPYKEMK